MEKSRLTKWGIAPFAIALLLVLVGGAPWMRPGPFERSGNTWEALAVDAVRAIKAGMIDKAYALCHRAIEAAGDGANGDTRLSRSYTLLGEIHTSAGKPDEALVALEKAVTVCENACGGTSTQLLEPLDALANFHFYRDEFAEVAPIYERIEQITDLARAQAERDLANRARNLAELHRKLGEFVEAEVEYEKCLAAGKSAGEMFRSDLLQDKLIIAEFYRENDKSEQAVELANDALALADDGSVDAAMALECLARIQLTSAEPQAAEDAARRSLRIWEKHRGDDSSDLATRLVLLASILEEQNKNSEAAEHLERALAVTEKDLGESPEVAAILEQQANVLEALGEADRAKATSARALAIRESLAQPADVAGCQDCGL